MAALTRMRSGDSENFSVPYMMVDFYGFTNVVVSIYGELLLLFVSL